jgi:hypothetical protein
MPPLHNAHEVLKKCNLTNATLTNTSGEGIPRSISWTQVSRSVFGNEEKYRECCYKGPKGGKVFVFVAEKAGPPPGSFNTSGHNGKLHLAIMNFETDNNAIGICFVIHPKDWYPFQHRFKTDTLTNAVHSGAGAAASAAAGAAIGSVVPGIGTAAGAVAGGVAGLVAPSLLGDYLHFLG